MYKLTEKEMIFQGKKYVVYGIKYGDSVTFDDISTSKDSVEALVRKFNTFSLDPVHLRDAIEDFLLEQ